MRRRLEDLHGFDAVTALQFAITRVREAYENGYDEIEFQHGAADVRERVADGRGRIKWALRDLLDGGRFDQWCLRGECWARAASLSLVLRRNRRPRAEAWSAAPRRTHR